MMSIWKRALKKLDVWDIALIKLSSAAFILFVITVWSGAMDLVNSIHWGWFLAAAIVFGLRSFKRAYL